MTMRGVGEEGIGGIEVVDGVDGGVGVVGARLRGPGPASFLSSSDPHSSTFSQPQSFSWPVWRFVSPP
jgi:hypothetical protein